MERPLEVAVTSVGIWYAGKYLLDLPTTLSDGATNPTTAIDGIIIQKGEDYVESTEIGQSLEGFGMGINDILSFAGVTLPESVDTSTLTMMDKVLLMNALYNQVTDQVDYAEYFVPGVIFGTSFIGTMLVSRFL